MLAIDPEIANEIIPLVRSVSFIARSISGDHRLTRNDHDLSVLVPVLLPQSRTSLSADESPPNVGIETSIKVLPRSLQCRLLGSLPGVTNDPANRAEVIVHLMNDLLHGLLVRGIGLVGLGFDVVVFGDLVGDLRSVGGLTVDDGLRGNGSKAK